jgi:hypothetical protein
MSIPRPSARGTGFPGAGRQKTQRDVVNHVVARFFPGGRPALFERAARRLNA